MRINTPITGFLIGLVMPILGFLVMYFLWGRAESISQFLRSTYVLRDLGSKVYTLSILANLVPFAFFNTKRYDQAARGVFIVTMLYVVFIILFKFVW
jgi:amino acid permease